MASGEFDLIARLRERLPGSGPRLELGSGADAAITDPGGARVATSVDAIVEGIHFDLAAFGFAAVGRKALAAALSDLAAMGAEPGEAYVVLGVGDGIGDESLLALADGMAEVAHREGVAIAGGDVTASPALTLAVTCVGYEPEGGALVSRSGGNPGDVLAVTGELGGAAAALKALHDPAADPELLARQFDPRPRIAAGRALAAAGASAMIDVSDGLGADAAHLARASGCSAEIELAQVPVQEEAARVFGDDDAHFLAAQGGEDFELLVALPPERLDPARAAAREAGTTLSEVGQLAEGEGTVIRAPDGSALEPAGFDHRRGSRSG